MYIIVHGDCGVYKFKSDKKDMSHHCAAIVGQNTVVGE